ncbi:MAG TPA: flagellar hook-length control protein FliK, partial [Pyrinomonadaceae bacterium]|nr:flagellar hook-length control protein FliK [Pyrinomonadaceae bacterium]
RDDNSLKANIVSGTPPEQSIADLVKQELTGNGSNSLDRSVTEPLIPDEKIKVTDRSVEAVFNASLNEAVTTLNLAHKPAAETIAREKVLEQVEPRMLELAAAVHNDGEKRVLKIRLTPPELGTVEVTLQKSSSGKIDAHFQTESHETRHILNEGLMQLRESLERSGMRVGDLDISFGSFSSTGNENRRDQSQKFGTAEVLSADTINFDGISKDEDDAGDRLVNLRA